MIIMIIIIIVGIDHQGWGYLILKIKVIFLALVRTCMPNYFNYHFLRISVQ